MKIYQDNRLKMVKPLSVMEVAYPGINPFLANIFDHPEALTFPHNYPSLEKSINLAHGGEANSLLLKSIMSLVNLRLLSKTGAAKVFNWLEKNPKTIDAEDLSRQPSVMYSFVAGVKNGPSALVGVCINSNKSGQTSESEIGMGTITASRLACGIKFLAEGKMNKIGVHSPEAGHIDPEYFLTEVLLN